MESAVAMNNGFSSIIMLLLFTIPMGIISYKLAKDKSRNVALWTVLGCMPLINYFCIIYFVGASNTRIEEKLDKLLGQNE